MRGIHTTFEGQNIIDLALQLYGDPLAFFTLLDDNSGLSLDQEIPAGTEVIYDEEKVDIRNKPLIKYFKGKLPQPIIIKTGSGFTGLED